MFDSKNQLNDLVLTSEDNGALLGEGSHEVTITSVSASMPKGAKFNDKTPQLLVVFKNKDGKQFSEWLNTVGYQRFADMDIKDKQSGLFTSKEGFAIKVDDGMRVKDAEKTKSALNIINKLGHDAGIPAASQFKPMDLVDRKLIIVVGNSNDGTYNNLRVKGTRPLAVTTEEAFS